MSRSSGDMPYWEVQIVGDAADLAMLAETFTGPAVFVEVRNGEHVLRSEKFGEHDSADEIRRKAEEIMTALSGSARLVLGAQGSLGVGTVYRVKPDGGRDKFVHIEPVELRFRALPPTVKITRTDGSVEIKRPADPIASWLEKAAGDQAVAKVLRLRDEDDLGWVELYRIYEVIEADVGSIPTQGWATEKALRRFKHTANSVGAVADDARHGKETTQPPKNPMSLPEARSLLDGIVQKWLQHKASN